MACHLLAAFIFVGSVSAGQHRPLPLLAPMSSANNLQRTLSQNREVAATSPFFRRPTRARSASSRALSRGCNVGDSFGNACDFGNHCGNGYPRSRSAQFDVKSRAMSETILSTRGGASSDETAVQNILKSILASSVLPSPIKRAIEIICQLIERLTGLGILPRSEPRQQKKKKSKAENGSKTIVKEVTITGAGKTKTRGGSTMQRGEVKGSAEAASRRKRKRSTKNTRPMPETKATITATQSQPEASANPPTRKPKPVKADAASKKFLSNDIKSSNPNYRIQRELKEFLRSPPPGLSVKISGKNVRLWVITLAMPPDTIYAGERYRLRVQFPKDYPTSPPSVYFLAPTPRHEHVYTNGDICLSLLGKDWRPIMTAQSVAQAIMSILCGAQRKSLPMDNARHAGNKPGKKQDDWVYHDDNC